MSRDIGAENRNVLRALADTLVPAGNGMPSASEVGVADSGLDEVLNIRPDIFGDLFRALKFAGNTEPAAALDSLASQDPEGWNALRLAVLGAYYNAPAVQEKIGYAGQPSMPADPDAVPPYLASLQRVKDRGWS